MPQDSNLSPLLFLIYINGICNTLNTTPRLIADNTRLVIHAANPSILCDNINHKLLSVLKWTKVNKITVDPKKFSVLILSPKIINSFPTIEILYNNNSVSVNKSLKDLGITINEKLNFAAHAIKLTCKIFDL